MLGVGDCEGEGAVVPRAGVTWFGCFTVLAFASSKQMERYEAAMSTVKSAAAKSAAHAKEIGDKTIDHTIDFARRSEAYYQTSQRRMEEVRTLCVGRAGEVVTIFHIET